MDINDMEDYYHDYDELFREILGKMMSKSTEKIRLLKINPNMYQKALNEFIKFGKLINYPTKYVEQWKNIVIQNYMYLDVITMFFGHTSYFDTDTFNDIVLYSDGNEDNYIKDWGDAWEYIEKMGYGDTLDYILPTFSNGADLISDYGLEPLGVIVRELYTETDPNKILVLINKALDVSHQRSDLSELFIEGGERSLNMISGMNESVFRIIMEELNKFINEDYRGSHTAPGGDDDAPMYDLTKLFPEDIYGNDAARRYKHYGDIRDNNAIHIMQTARNKPNKPIKIYRAVPIDAEDSTINDGDWVTIDPMYAKNHGKSNLNNQYKVITKTVPARQLFTDANDIFEWGYKVN